MYHTMSTEFTQQDFLQRHSTYHKQNSFSSVSPQDNITLLWKDPVFKELPPSCPWNRTKKHMVEHRLLLWGWNASLFLSPFPSPSSTYCCDALISSSSLYISRPSKTLSWLWYLVNLPVHLAVHSFWLWHGHHSRPTVVFATEGCAWLRASLGSPCRFHVLQFTEHLTMKARVIFVQLLEFLCNLYALIWSQ